MDGDQTLLDVSQLLGAETGDQIDAADAKGAQPKECSQETTEEERKINQKIAEGVRKAMFVLVQRLDAQLQSKLSIVIKDEIKKHHYSLNCCDMKVARTIAN